MVSGILAQLLKTHHMLLLGPTVLKFPIQACFGGRLPFILFDDRLPCISLQVVKVSERLLSISKAFFYQRGCSFCEI